MLFTAICLRRNSHVETIAFPLSLRSNSAIRMLVIIQAYSIHAPLSRYYDDAACVLRGMLLRAVAPHLYSPLPTSLPWNVPGLSCCHSCRMLSPHGEMRSVG